jgi:hypothetical protein
MYTSILLIISVYTVYTHKQQRILSLPIETVCKQVNMEKQGLVLVLGLLARTSAGKRFDNFLLQNCRIVCNIFYGFEISVHWQTLRPKAQRKVKKTRKMSVKMCFRNL